MTADHVFTALASPARRELLRLLLDEGAQPAGRLAERFDMSRPSVSEHLKVLKDAGLVAESRRGRERHYRLEAGPLMEIRDWLSPYERFWRERLAGLVTLLDEMEDDDVPPR
ncbi:metalloregulator ArsR/SmtB family transcription factor [Nonomuraea fuscirosea]|uniref:DNA-binding transcriptional ArsR family regulator n=1 Tax=Nonomuraea fuscirosea TaxID=1291556 RepID=A0A2T0MTX4_9ACTN|nr:metalloregulator ArsR/SmtB family transcription factor [Nonomuraea fuscirosea]PRX62151.1 DNA-binding transcriptional ArsR family regulator [Nonomuraea fuscirosea]WSA57987.1 metalloregulator ArsR/SmtB family transcription factor [Nonomuraea fuscirosea]